MQADSAGEKALRVGIVAGETSGDILGAGLIRELRKHYPSLVVEGICGPLMIAEGGISHVEMNTISIMGLDGLFGSIVKILRIRRNLEKLFLESPPDIFVGIDVPDFNLTLEKKLKKAGIKTIHYVSPTVWAWRGYRIHKIRRAVSRMLVLFPFEASYYHHHNVPVSFVGHPIADDMTVMSMSEARKCLNISDHERVVAILPGSRKSEVSRLAPVFTETAVRLHKQFEGIRFVIPCASQQLRTIIESSFGSCLPPSAYEIVDGNAQTILRGANVALLASGTAALECALLGTPMVVAYRLSTLSYLMVKTFSQVKYYSMPNHLLSDAPVEEFIQNRANAENITPAVAKLLTNTELNQQVRVSLESLLPSLKRNANKRATDAIITELQR